MGAKELSSGPAAPPETASGGEAREDVQPALPQPAAEAAPAPPRRAPPPPPRRLPAWALPASKRASAASPGAPTPAQPPTPAPAATSPSPTPAAPLAVEGPVGSGSSVPTRAAASPQLATVSPRAKARPPKETTKRSSVAPAVVFEDSEHSAPKAAPIPRELGAILAAEEAAARVAGEPAAAAPPSDSEEPRDMPVVGVFGDYEVFGRLAFGGMAEIFLARDASPNGSGRYVVIKRILPHVADDEVFVQMFLDEARLAIKLSHPNICHIYEFGRQDQSYFIAMEWVNGISLGKLIARTQKVGGIPISIAVKIISHIAEALHYAHRARDERGRPLGIVHRDVSPQNIMVSYEAGVKLLDFGVAKAESQGTKTVAGTVKGKFAYMSPQHCMGQPIDARSDIFSLGICLYEALTSKKLYHRPNEYETMKVIVDGEVPSARAVRPDLPEALDAIVKKALAKNPEDRFQTAGAMQTALERFLGDTHEVVGATRVSEYLDGLYHTEIRRGPQVDPSISTGLSRVRARPDSASPGEGRAAAAVDVDIPVDVAGESRRPSKRGSARWFALAAFAVLAAAGSWVLTQTASAPAVTTGDTRQSAPDARGEPRTPTTPTTATTTATTAPPDNDVAPPVATTGTVAVRSTPSGARVQIDGVDVPGTTPLEIPSVPVGDHVVRVAKPGFAAWTGHVMVAAGAPVAVAADLPARPRTPAAPPGMLSVNTRPWSKVYIGSQLLGTTPIGGATVPSGSLRLRLVDRDGNTHTHVVQVAPGGSARVSLDFTTP